MYVFSISFSLYNVISNFLSNEIFLRNESNLIKLKKLLICCYNQSLLL